MATASRRVSSPDPSERAVICSVNIAFHASPRSRLTAHRTDMPSSSPSTTSVGRSPRRRRAGRPAPLPAARRARPRVPTGRAESHRTTPSHKQPTPGVAWLRSGGACARRRAAQEKTKPRELAALVDSRGPSGSSETRLAIHGRWGGGVPPFDGIRRRAAPLVPSPRRRGAPRGTVGGPSGGRRGPASCPSSAPRRKRALTELETLA